MEKGAGRRSYQRRRGQKTVLGRTEKRRLVQLGACLVLFLSVFFAKGMDRLGGLRTELARALWADADFQGAFADLGWSLAAGQPVGTSLNVLWTDVFLPQEKAAPKSWREGPLYQSVQRDMLRGEETAVRLLTGVETGEAAADPMGGSGARGKPQPAQTEPEPKQEPEVTDMGYDGPALPDNTTMDRYALGLSETMAPVEAVMSSGFGWREHPISGGEKFHYGVDLAVDTGTTVHAFAAGVVDYIGESDVYGQYLQIDHGNGVTSFYAHCSKLCVQQGQTVAMGEKVAESGATGEVTGPHLHFEMKKNGVRLNPSYYIKTLT